MRHWASKAWKFEMVVFATFVTSFAVGMLSFGKASSPVDHRTRGPAGTLDTLRATTSASQAPSSSPQVSEGAVQANEEDQRNTVIEYHAVVSRRDSTLPALRTHLPRIRFDHATFAVAKEMFLKELANGKLDEAWLSIMFRCSSALVTDFVFSRLREGACSSEELSALASQLESKSEWKGRSDGIVMSNELLSEAVQLAASYSAHNRRLAAAILSNSNSVESQQRLCEMGEKEESPEILANVLEGLAGMDQYPDSLFGRVDLLTQRFDYRNVSKEQFQRILDAFNRIKEKVKRGQEGSNR